MISEQEFYNLWNDYDSIITKMNTKLMEFKSKNPSFDISEQLQTLNTLRSLQDIFHKQYQLIVTLDGQHGKWHSEKKRMLDKISELEKENNNLKEAIS